MGFLNKKKEEEQEIEVIEEEIESAETELEVLKEKDDSKKPEEDNVEVVVVKDLPMQPVRFTTKEDGTKVEFITTEEALSKILNS